MGRSQHRSADHRHTDPMIVCDQCYQIRRWLGKSQLGEDFYLALNRGIPCKSLIFKHKRVDI